MENAQNYFVSRFCGSRRNIFNNFLLCVHKSIKAVKTFLYVFTLQAQPTRLMTQPLGCRGDCAPGEALLHQAAGVTGDTGAAGVATRASASPRENEVAQANRGMCLHCLCNDQSISLSARSH